MSIGPPDSPSRSQDRIAELDSLPRLVADIGGTNARFALVIDGKISHDQTLVCAEHTTLVDAIETYLSALGTQSRSLRPVEAALAIAAPITDDQIRMTNHPWSFSATAARNKLGLRRLIILNDFTALAMSLRYLPPAELEQIGGLQPKPQTAIALIGPGTGLGVSGLLPLNNQWLPLQGEGGHCTLAVMSEREQRILDVLHQRYSHVSTERVISGPGMVNIYSAICTLEAQPTEELEPADITQRGLSGESRICREVLNVFCGLFGTIAGNLALTLGAHGGLYIGGGIIPRLGRFFASSPFRARFEDKGRYADYLAPIPAYVIHSEKPAFIGATRAFVDPGPRLEVS
jgi:glucokinase